MGILANEIGQKSAGDLIKSGEWNRLVRAVEGVETSLTERIESLESELTNQKETLGQQIAQLRSDEDTLQATVNPLLDQYYRITLSTTKINYALGELAELTVQVNDLQGNPLSFSNTDRPWVDLIATWGQFKPVAGFSSRGGVGDRTISVRTDTSGQARVQLRSDYAEGLTDDDEAEMAAAISTRPATLNQPIYQYILNANTPLEAKPAYQIINAEYERSPRVRTYLDTHYLRNPALQTGNILPFYRSRWRDYRATVMAFAKPDSDPRTPDASLGVSSLQVTFRDWIGPWIVDYVRPPVEELPIDIYRERFGPKITKDYRESADLLRDDIQDILRDRGIVAKQREYGAIRNALEGLAPTTTPDFLNRLVKGTQDAIAIQQTISKAQSTTLGLGSQEIAFNVLSEANLRADTDTASIRTDIDDFKTSTRAELDNLVKTEVNQGIQQARNILQAEQATFRRDLVSDDGVLGVALDQAVGNRIVPLENQVRVLNTLNPETVNNQFNEVSTLKAKVNLLENTLKFIDR
ncbi:MAG: hypothetical protein ACFB2W_25720 [Leptolyngbyaceae cyanobacterium]